MASNILEKPQISWDLQDPDEKLRVLTQLIINEQHDTFVDILAGINDIGIASEQLIKLCSNLSSDIKKLVALKTKSRNIAEALISSIEDPNILIDLTLYGASVHARKNAVLAITDQSVLNDLQQQLAGKDKTVCKILNEKLLSAPAKSSTAKLATERPLKKKNQKEKKESTTTDTRSTSAIELSIEIQKLEQEYKKLSFKNTDRLNDLGKALDKIQKSIPKKHQDILDQYRKLHISFEEKLKENKVYQEALTQSTEDLLVNLQKALDCGRSSETLSTWDKIQANISKTSGKLKISLQSVASPYKTVVEELRDWKLFAATERKRALIKQMQNLLNSKMHPKDISKHINNIHKNWKTLGRSNQNEELWNEFKELSDSAYEPCKIYFKERKQLMATNLKARQQICSELEVNLTTLNASGVNISALNKLLHSCEQNWKKHAPVEQSKIKNLQKRYYGILGKLRRLRKDTLQDNAKLKLKLIAEAIKASEQQDKQKAIYEAKRLQQEWKKIGPTSYKEDKQYWEEFRTMCDKIFAQHKQKSAAARALTEKTEHELKSILKRLETISKLENDTLRGERSAYQDLQQAFTTVFDPKSRRLHKNILDEFNNLKRKIDTRFKTMPNKKLQNLKNAVLDKANFLCSLEVELLSSKDNSHFISIKSKLEKGSWNELPPSGDKILDAILENRAETIFKTNTITAFKSLAKERQQQLRSLCIELEIRANIDAPEEDQSLRMQIQLHLLKSGFGQSKPDRKADILYAQDAELQAYCIGPLEQQIQKTLLTRIERATEKLL